MMQTCLACTESKTDTDNRCIGMKMSGRGGRKIKLEVGLLPYDSLPSVHTVHVQATSKTCLSRPLRVSWTFVVVDTPLQVAIRWLLPALAC